MAAIKPVFILLLLMTMLGVFPIDVILPSIPALARHLGTQTQSITASIGLLTVLVALAQLVIGRASDRYGRKPLLLASLVVAITGSIGCTYAQTATAFHAWRAIQAIGCGGFVLAHALVQDLFDAEQRTRQRIWLSTAGGVFISISPLFGVFLQTHAGWQGSFWVFALLASLAMLLAAKALPSSGKRHNFSTNVDSTPANPVRFSCAAAITMLGFVAHFSFIVLSPVVFLELLQTPANRYGLIMLCYGAAYLLGGMLATTVARRAMEFTQIRLGLALIAVGGGAMGAAHMFTGITSASLLGGACLMTCGVTLMRPAATTLAMNALPGRAGSAAAGLNAMTFMGGGVISFLLGLIATEARWVLPTTWLVISGLGFALCRAAAMQPTPAVGAATAPALE